MIKFNNHQLKQLAEFTSSASVLFLGTAVGPIFVPAGHTDPSMLALGLVLTVMSLSISILLLKGGKER